MSHADTALYRAKVEGRGTYRFFEAAMGAEVKERRHIEHDLLHAISRGELRLAYQPQKQLTTRRGHRLRGAAALAASASAAPSRPASSSRSPRRAG